MNGIEILAQNTIYETEYNYWYLLIFAGIGLLIGLTIAIVNWVKYGFDEGYFIIIVLMTVGCTIFGGYGVVFSEHETDIVDHIEYKVTVADDVNFVDFMDKYEILDQDGRIYTVKERE